MFYRKAQRNRKPSYQSHTDAANAASDNGGKPPISAGLADNLAYLRQELGDSPDMIVRTFEIGGNRIPAGAVYMDGITDKDMVNEYILKSLMIEAGEAMNPDEKPDILAYLKANALTIGEVHLLKDWDCIILSVLSGDTVIFLDGSPEAISGNTKGGEQRTITEPSTQVVIRGPKDGFTESIGTNVSLVRRRIKSSSVRLEPFKIGQTTKTNVAVMYIQGKAEDHVVQLLRERLSGIQIEALTGSELLEELIQDQKKSPFSTLINTERPDTVANHLLDGRIAIFVDGTPFNLIAPTTFLMNFLSTEDYYTRPEAVAAIIIVRYAALIISLFAPSIYIAAITFHQEMIPTPLLLSLASQRESVPFPAFIEALIMEFTFEILREAGIRMPRAIGQAVSIVGALVLGQAAVEAGIISSAMVIVVAITGISSFANPSYNMALSIRLIRFFLMVAAALFGFYGIAIFSIILISHMCSLSSFGVPYMTIKTPSVPEAERKTLFGIPLTKEKTKPQPAPDSGGSGAGGNDQAQPASAPSNLLNESGSS
ncbi:spore germination protein [Paenibacillus sp. N4]|uniref:spore germination protein n=1 Tax=Paenibacillus vietnamensis TaxID=2590547 RepID=UPI001CD0AA00|nr:spore germination protein [Paenibacillus vietnamensis]MCA0758489.1 spore germination protein [Paenibacillus vietnamensis]